MNREIITMLGEELEEILFKDSLDFTTLDLHHKFVGVDHDLWEFEAILSRAGGKFFKVNWFDNYSCSWKEIGLDTDEFELTQVFPKEVLTIIYE